MRRGLMAALLLLLFALAIAVAASTPARVAAQAQPPITFDVRIGYAGVYRIGEWFPIGVSIGNDGPDLRGVLENALDNRLEVQTRLGQLLGVCLVRSVDIPHR